MNTVSIEIVGYREMECCPFPCDNDRTCGLDACYPTNQLIPAVKALREKIYNQFGDRVSLTLTLLDEGVPDHIKAIYESEHPAIPMVLINEVLLPLGRISWSQIREAVNLVASG
ncbi:MAG TPA: hypothetical protein VN372_15720 [Methanospirillum sp.]|nr:hypothetical protein [Methanospirillum sp.]